MIDKTQEDSALENQAKRPNKSLDEDLSSLNSFNALMKKQIAITKNLITKRFLILCLLFSISCASVHKFEQRMENFHTHKNCRVAQNFLIKLSHDENSKHSNFQGLIGQLSGIFIVDKSCESKILSTSNKLSNYGLSLVILKSLVLAESHENAKDFAAKNNLNDELNYLKDTKSIKITVYEFEASTNDLLIGAYSSTGDNFYISRILQNFKTADKKMAKDAIRFGFLFGKFGNSLSYKDHYTNMVQSLKKKYYNEKDPNPKQFLRLMSLSSAFWALNSLAENDENLAKYLKQFFAEGELKNIFLIEQNHFSNYLTALVLDASGIGEPDTKSPSKEKTKIPSFAQKNKKLIADYEELKEPNVMELMK